MTGLRLYPDSPGTSLQDMLHLRHLDVKNRPVSTGGLSGFPGKVQSRQRGNGMDFDDLRRYIPGDDVRHIDWNVTARTQQPHIRLYREDRERSVTVAVDLRPSMFTGSSCFRADRAVRLAALTLWHASSNGDRCAATVYDQIGIHSSQPAIAERGVLDALGLLAQRYQTASQSPDYSADPPLVPWLDFLTGSGRQAGSVIFLSALDNPGRELEESLKKAAHHRFFHTVVLSDPIELAQLPPGDFAFLHKGQARQATLSRRAASRLKSLQDKSFREKLAPWRKHKLPLLLENEHTNPSEIPRLLHVGGII